METQLNLEASKNVHPSKRKWWVSLISYRTSRYIIIVQLYISKDTSRSSSFVSQTYPSRYKTEWYRVSHSTPCANIITSPGSTIISSFICWFSQEITTTACLPGNGIFTLLITKVTTEHCQISDDTYDHKNVHFYHLTS